jgi:prepilin-type processing-associated H-X9-DG protein
LLVVIAIIGILIALLLPAVQAAREAARRAQCVNNMKQLAMGMHLYSDSFKSLPSGGFNNVERSLYTAGWAARIFPYIEQKNYYEQMQRFHPYFLNFCQPWRLIAPPHNGNDPIFHTPIPTLACPSSPLGNKYGLSNPVDASQPNMATFGALHYRANGGSAVVNGVDVLIKVSPDARRVWINNGVVYPESKVDLAQVKDGTSNTFLLGETSAVPTKFGVTWTNATQIGWGGLHSWLWGYYWYNDGGWLMQDHKFIQHPINFPGPNLARTSGTPYTSAHPGGVNVVMCDGSVRFLLDTTPMEILQRAATRNGGLVYEMPGN